jgi:uncharacterized membrane-anchored protein YjiN (DUF445 family)
MAADPGSVPARGDDKPTPPPSPPSRRNHVGSVSLVVAAAGATASHVGLTSGPFAGATWLRIAAAGFEAALVGGLADWFAVTAIFRHPLGLPIPHTALIRERRDKIIESIVSMVEHDWLSPEVIGARLARIAPSGLVIDWLADPGHLERIGAPLRDLLRALADMLVEDEVVEFGDRTIQSQLRELPIDRAAGRWLEQLATNESAGAAFESLATSLANLAERPQTARQLTWWLERSAQKLREQGQRLVPLVLRRKLVQRKIVEATCAYASSELRSAAREPSHPLREVVLGAIRRFAGRLAAGDAEALAQVEGFRAAVLESLEAAPLVRDVLRRLRGQLRDDLEDPQSSLSQLVDRKLRDGIVKVLETPEQRAAFDDWVRSTADDLLRRHHHQIGLTVRENLEALETDVLVERIEDRVGADLQFIRLNGAVVGGLIGVLLALAHLLAGR